MELNWSMPPADPVGIAGQVTSMYIQFSDRSPHPCLHKFSSYHLADLLGEKQYGVW